MEDRAISDIQANAKVDPRSRAAGSRIRFIETTGDLDLPVLGVLTAVLDPSWTPSPGSRVDVVSVLPSFAAVLEKHDLFKESLALIDAWADQVGLVDRFVVSGVSYWFRLRETMWHWVHERFLWRYALDNLRVDDGLTSFSVPWTEPALIDIVRAIGGPLDVVGPPPVNPPPRSLVARFLPAPLRRIYRRFRPHPETVRMQAELELERTRDALLDARMNQVAALGSNRILVLSTLFSFQRIGGLIDGHGEDPNLGAVMPELRAAQLEPLSIACDIDRTMVAFWPLIEKSNAMLPEYFVQARWGRPEDEDLATAEAERVASGVRDLSEVPLLLDGVDIAGPFVEALAMAAQGIVRAEVRRYAFVNRMVADLRPRALLMTHEGHRTPWLVISARHGIPTFALQHGVLYPGHPGYPTRRDRRHVLPTCTFVFGNYERRALEESGYLPAEVIVSGSPRIDLDAPPPGGASAAEERETVRHRLGVGADDRVLVVSTGHLAFMRRSHLAHMVAQLLGGPLPGVHIVFKQHPGEHDEGPYRSLLAGLAGVGGYAPPQISVIRDIDLYQLLRASDAHLGQISTVLTDAVVAGTCNLIADIQASPPPIDYVKAGVAWPVRNVSDVRDAMQTLPCPTPEARRAFLDDHFRKGNPSGRIVEAIVDVIRDRAA